MARQFGTGATSDVADETVATDVVSTGSGNSGDGTVSGSGGDPGGSGGNKKALVIAAVVAGVIIVGVAVGMFFMFGMKKQVEVFGEA